MELSALLTSQVLGVGAVFARIGAMILFLPGLGEQSIPVRHRLAMALALSIALYPALPVGPVEAGAPLAMLRILGVEVTLGLWFGVVARVLMSALTFAGYQVGIVSGLANALAPGQGAFEGATLVASALTMAGIALIFVTDLHHVIIGAMVSSYEVLPQGALMPGDLASQMVRAGATSLYLGVSMAAPFYVMGLVLNVGLGLANRLMPTLPVFFVATPVLVGAGLLVLVFAGPAMLSAFIESMSDWLGTLTF
ncbi:flagellar export pore protein FliR [Roseivivax marinus]|uniref:Flagellar export pore protein FliR n=1 Tax=Roseivivax marinus TaxID=1379903 RepID=W4HFH8_9RHOB|nr:flagellar biosynthetic protein FliR [Roseivivax marinus]ETW11449.1 flagellar export pore protein FliR [Roseivivax marinus]